MLVNQAYRYELDPNNVQGTLFAKHAGTARFAWNWALARRIERFEKNEGKARFTCAAEQHREWNEWKRTGAPWWTEVSKCAPQEAFRDLDQAFKNFCQARKAGREVGFPKFKKRGLHDSFRLTGAIHVKDRAVVLPRIGSVRTKERTAIQGRVLSASVNREADRWFVSLTVERSRPDPQPVHGPAAGIDVGLESFAVLSDGARIDSPKPLEKSLKRLRRASKKHSRKHKGSKNRRKSALRLARLHRRVRNQRSDFLHQATTELAKTKSAIVLEDLNVAGMVRNKSLARSISDSGWSQFRRQLEYKTRWYGSTLLIAPRFFPSSKRCSDCGYVKPKLSLSERIFRCENCGLEIDRDLNASKNLESLVPRVARELTPVETPLAAERPLLDHSTSHGSLKQEADAVHLTSVG
jgi:putative transposase